MTRRIDDIEFLRAFAVMAVIVEHANGNLVTSVTPLTTRLHTYFGGGFGVDLFFAISGFVIARQLIPQLRECTSWNEAIPVMFSFWLRRIWRLWPAAWLWLAIILLSVLLFNQAGAFGTLRANIEATVAGVLQVANLRFAETFGAREYGASFPYWSLSLEEQFYLVLPIVAFAVRKYLPALLCALIAEQLFVPRTLMMIAFRTDALALGILIALWEAQPTYRLAMPAFLSLPLWRFGVLLGALICLSLLGSPVLDIVSIRFSLIALASSILVWIASYDMNYISGNSFLKKPMLWIGSRSYALYLVHVPAFFLMREVFFRIFGNNPPEGIHYTTILVLTTMLLIGFLSELNFRIVETPLRAYGARVARNLIQSTKSQSK